MSLPVQATLSENKWVWGGYSHKSANTLEHNKKKIKAFFSCKLVTAEQSHFLFYSYELENVIHKS